MRIAVLASIAHRTPPLAYGPWEQVASTLAEGLVARGHDVTLFATADSVTAGRLHAVAPHGYEEVAAAHGRDGYDVKVLEALHIAAAFERAGSFDVLSNQFDFLPLAWSRLVGTPVVTTIHGFSSEAIVPVYRAYDDIATYVSISDADRHRDLTYARTIHHGIDTDAFTYRADHDGYLLFLGRIHPDKGTHHAVEVARRCGLPLVIAGIVHDEAYFAELVEPHVGRDGISYVGPVGPPERDRLLGGAAAMLHLIGFDEPFGLSVVESLATGTPVVAFARGSLPELVTDGETGFLVRTVDEAVDAVGRVPGLSRQRCRDEAVARFDHDRMVGEYEALFEQVASGARRRPAGPAAGAGRRPRSGRRGR